MSVALGRGSTQHSCCGTSHFKIKHQKIRNEEMYMTYKLTAAQNGHAAGTTLPEH